MKFSKLNNSELYLLHKLLSPYVMWSGKTRHIVQNIKFELLVSYESLNYLLFRTFYLGLLWYCCQNLWKNMQIMVLISFILPFHSATCDKFSQITVLCTGFIVFYHFATKSKQNNQGVKFLADSTHKICMGI